MFLTKLIIINNKSCRKVILEPSKNEPEILIGINDCGKSTILKSLDLFFDEKKKFNFIKEDQQKNDLSNSPLNNLEINKVLEENGYPNFFKYSGDIILVICKFEIEENDLKNDEFQESSKNAHLKWSIIGNEITLMRVSHNFMPETQNLSGYYLLTNDYQYNERYLELWNETSKGLTEIKKKFNIESKDVDNKNNTGRLKNIESIEAIYKKISTLEMKWSKYNDFSKDKAFYPNFKYLDWNFSLKELEDIATEAMNKVTEPLLQEIKQLVSKKQSEAIIGVNNEFVIMMGGLKDDLPKCIKKISSSVFFNVSQKITDIKLEKENVDGEINIDNQGEGIKRQIWFALLKWRSKLISNENKSNKYIWCFDEPETHLYPAAQRQLFETLKEMCSNEFQILLSTHSTIFIDRTKINDVKQVTLESGYSTFYKSDSSTDLFNCLGIKNSDFLFFDKFLAVEGFTEYDLIPHLYQLKYFKSLLNDGIQIINLKGEAQYINNKSILENILSDFQKTSDKVFYLFDNDTGLSGDNIFTSGIYDIEDSIKNSIWIEFIKDNCNVDITDDILNNEIRNKLENKKDKKFYKLLGDYVAINYDKYLPSKSESGQLLSKYFKEIKDIPEQINNLFNVLNS